MRYSAIKHNKLYCSQWLEYETPEGWEKGQLREARIVSMATVDGRRDMRASEYGGEPGLIQSRGHVPKAREVIGKAYRSDPAEKDLGDDSGVIAERFEPV